MEQLERLLLVASGAQLSPEDVTTHAWTTGRTAALGAVLQKMLRGCTEGAVSVTTGLVTSISRFALQARPVPRKQCKAHGLGASGPTGAWRRAGSLRLNQRRRENAPLSCPLFAAQFCSRRTIHHQY